MKIKLTDSQYNTLLIELTLGHKDGYALIDNKPYKIKKGIITVNVKDLRKNKDDSASLSWSALGKSGNELISKDVVKKIVDDIYDKKEDIEIPTKMGNVNLVPK